jgi:predicted hotdog family 3-hydroxylacyl-ACP dehydratase
MELPVRYPDILNLLPQAPPFVFVDELVWATQDAGNSRYVMPAHHFLSSKGRVSAEALLEIMAQTGALHQGYRALSEGRERPVGFIAAVDRAVFHVLPPVGVILETVFTFKNLYGTIAVAEGCITQENKLIAEAVFKIFSRDNSSF